VRELTPDVFRIRFGILIRDVEVHLRDVWFYFRKFTGIKWEDHGIMDLDLDGMTINWDYSAVYTNAGRWEFALRDADCDIRKVAMRFKRAKHRALDGLIAGLFAGTIKKRVERMVKEQLWAKGEGLSRRLNYWFNERPMIMRERRLERERLEGGRRRVLGRPVKKVTKRKFKKYEEGRTVSDKKLLPERRGFFGQKKETYPADDLAPERVGPLGNIKETYPAERPATTYVEEKEYVGYEPSRKGSFRKATTKEDYYEKKEMEEPLDRKYRHEATGRNVETSA